MLHNFQLVDKSLHVNEERRTALQRGHTQHATGSERPTLYVDVSNTVEFYTKNRTLTGIQRVTVNLISELINALGDSINISGIVNLAGFGGPFKVGQDKLSESGIRTIVSSKTLEEYLCKYDRKPFRKWFQRARLRLAGAFMPSILEDKNISLAAGEPRDREFAFSAGDIVLSMAGGWDLQDLEAVLPMKERGVRFFIFMHDVIPVIAPDLCGGAKGKAAFEKNLIRCAALDPVWICNSRYTEVTFKQVCSSLGLAEQQTCVVPLAHEFIQSEEGEIRAEVARLAGEKFILCVGSRGRRKNIGTLIDAFEIACAGREDVKLVLAGKGRVKKAARNGRIVLIDNPSDRELQRLYETCQFTVFPSLMEGWGLPVGESLWFGKRVICGNNSSLTEVGGRYAKYVDVGDAAAVAAAIGTARNDCFPAGKMLCNRGALRTWSQVAGDIVSVLNVLR